MKVRYSARAATDLATVHQYLSERSPTGAAKVMGGNFCCRRVHEATPNIPGVHCKVVKKYHFKVFYRVSDDVIENVHVRHTSRQAWQGE